VWLLFPIISFYTNRIFVNFPILDEKNAQKFLCKTVFAQYFFLKNSPKNRLDVIGVVIFLEKSI
jgi:hypothetical protein